MDFVFATFVVGSDRRVLRASLSRIAISKLDIVIGSLRKTAFFLAERRTKSIALLVSAALALILTAFATNAGRILNASEIEKTFRGITLDGIYDDGRFFSETYFDDGSIRYHDADGADSGDWSVRKDMFCTFYGGQEGACFFVIRDGANCFIFFGSIEGADGGLMPDESWTAQGWNRQSKATCINPPEAVV